jgi:hypothetical protein
MINNNRETEEIYGNIYDKRGYDNYNDKVISDNMILIG